MRRQCLNVTSRFIGTTLASSYRHNSSEQQREDDLRKRIQETYKNMKLPSLTDFTYGQFQPSKFGATANTNNNSSSSSSNNNGGNSNDSQQQQQQGPAAAGPDYLMLGTGLVLVYVTSQALSDRVSGTVLPTNEQFRKDPLLNQFSVPLWCSSAEMQAYYLLFLISVEGPARESLRLEYQNLLQAQQLPPFTTFFDWILRYQRLPVFGCGTQWDRQTVVATLVNALTTGTSMQLAGLGGAMAKAVQESTTSSSSSSTLANWFPVLSSSFGTTVGSNNGAPAMPGVQPNPYNMQARIDRFVGELQKQGFAIGGVRAQQQQQQAPPSGYGYVPQQAYYQQQQQMYGGQQQQQHNPYQQQQQSPFATHPTNAADQQFAASAASNGREMQLESLKNHNRLGQQVSLEEVLNSVQGGKQQHQ